MTAASEWHKSSEVEPPKDGTTILAKFKGHFTGHMLLAVVRWATKAQQWWCIATSDLYFPENPAFWASISPPEEK